jgi:hypothetical protein
MFNIIIVIGTYCIVLGPLAFDYDCSLVLGGGEHFVLIARHQQAKHAFHRYVSPQRNVGQPHLRGCPIQKKQANPKKLDTVLGFRVVHMVF